MGGLVDLFRARVLLFQLELRDVANSARKLVFLYVAATTSLVVAYLCVTAGTLSLVARLLELPWDIVAVGAGGLHALAAMAFFVCIKRVKRDQPFRESLNQMEKDRQWLESKTEPPQS